MNFASDNTAGAHPALLAAIAKANEGAAPAYGEDPFSHQLVEKISELFERPVKVFPVATGTAANSLSLATLSPPWGTVLCHREAHIENDECGAPEFFGGGLKLVPSEGANAKLSAAQVEAMLPKNSRGVHTMPPKALSISQLSERGCAYRPEEVAALGAVAKRANLGFHMDGARFANALAFLECKPAEVTWRAGVDILCLGGTKNGALAAEAIIVFNDQLADELAYRRKRSGQLFSKGRFIAAQFLAHFEDNLWLTLAARANALARRVGQAAKGYLSNPVEGNQVFIQPGPEKLAKLRQQGFHFYDWGPPELGEGRLMISFNQAEEDVERLCEALAAL